MCSFRIINLCAVVHMHPRIKDLRTKISNTIKDHIIKLNFLTLLCISIQSDPNSTFLLVFFCFFLNILIVVSSSVACMCKIIHEWFFGF